MDGLSGGAAGLSRVVWVSALMLFADKSAGGGGTARPIKPLGHASGILGLDEGGVAAVCRRQAVVPPRPDRASAR